MLEIPSLAFCIAATYFWFKFLLEEDHRALPWFGVFATAALMTKQNSFYLLLFCALSIFVLRKYRLLANRRAMLIGALSCLVIAPFYIAVYVIHWRTIVMDLTEPSASIYEKLSFYPRALPDQLGWVLLTLAALGIATGRSWSKYSGASALMLTWIASVYLTFTVIGHKEARYALYWIPAFLYFAGGLLTNDRLWLAGRKWKAAAAGVLVATTLISAWRYQRPRVEGYAAAARWITATGKSGVILYEANLPGNFIFFVRANDPGRKFVVLRKALYTNRLKRQGGRDQLIRSRESLQDMIRRSGVRFFLIGKNRQPAIAARQWLRDLLQTPQFRLVATFPITATNTEVHHGELQCYENVDWQRPTDQSLRIRMLTLNDDIVVPFSELSGDTEY
jgi:hypothetical protein